MIRTVIAVSLLTATSALATESPYAGQDQRKISSFSETDIAAIEAGEGWGLAKPAELNGWPGPRHVLDAADDLELTPNQIARIQAIFDSMNADARQAGARMLNAERALDAAFEEGAIDRERLLELLATAEAARTELRGIHLAAHLKTTPILSRHQRMMYDQLRGYGGAAGEHGGHGGNH